MSRQDHDSLVMDYVYDELRPVEREAFERRMQADPALREEVESFQSTRAMFSDMGEMPAAPPVLMQNLIREARLAVAVEPQPSLFDRIAAMIMQPAFGAAALVLLVAFTGLMMNVKGDKQPTEGVAPNAHEARITNDGARADGAMTVASAEDFSEKVADEGRFKEAAAPMPVPRTITPAADEPTTAEGALVAGLDKAEADLDDTLARPETEEGEATPEAPALAAAAKAQPAQPAATAGGAPADALKDGDLRQVASADPAPDTWERGRRAYKGKARGKAARRRVPAARAAEIRR